MRHLSNLRMIAVICVLACGASISAQVDGARDDYNFAAGLYDRGLFDRAVRAFEGFLDKWPEDARRRKALFYLGQCLVERGDNEGALARFDAALKSPGDDFAVETQFRRGELLQRLGRSAEAARVLASLLERRDLGALEEMTLYFHAEAALAAGDDDAGARSHARLLERFPSGAYSVWSASALGFRAQHQGRHEEAEALFAHAAKSEDATLAAEAAAMVGEARLSRRDFEGALSAFTAAARLPGAGNDARAAVGRARALLELKRSKEAVAALQSAGEVFSADPVWVRAVLRVASVLHERGETALGLAALDLTEGRVSGQDARDVDYWRGLLSTDGGAIEEGIERLAAAVKAGGGPRRKFGLADALARAGRHEEAASLFAEVSKESEDAEVKNEARFAEAYSRNRLGDHERAVALLRSLEAADAASELREDVAFALGENLFALGRFADADRAYSALDNSTKHAVAAAYKRGWCAYRLGRHEAALSHFDVAVRGEAQTPWRGEVCYLMGKCHEALGRTDDARKAFESAGREGAGGVGQRGRLGAALAARQSGDVEAARRGFESLTDREVEPELRGEALFGLAELAVESGDRERALAMYRLLTDELPAHARAPEATLGRAWTLRDLGRHDEAARAAAELTQRADAASFRGEALYLLGLEQVAAKSFDAACTTLDSLLTGHPGHARETEARLLAGIAAARAGRHEDAAARLRPFLAASVDTPGRATALYELAFACEALKDEAGRDRAQAALVADHPESAYAADAAFRQAETLYAREDFEAARAMYLATAERSDAAALRDKCIYKAAWCDRKRGRHEDAASHFAAVAAIEASELAAESLYLSGDEFVRADKHEAARAAFDAMTRRFKKHELAADAACRLLIAASALGDHEVVIRDAARTLSGRGGDGWSNELRSALGDAYFEIGKFAPARAAYVELTRNDEGELAARAQYRIGACREREGDREVAVDEFLKVSILYANRVWGARAMSDAARLLDAAGESAKATRLRSELAERYPETPEGKVARAANGDHEGSEDER